MKFKPIRNAQFYCLLSLTIILFSNCQRSIYTPPERAFTKGSRVPFSSESELKIEKITQALFHEDASPCLQEVVVIRGFEDQFQVYNLPSAGFPTEGSSYFVMSSGDATNVVPGTAAGTFSSVFQGDAEGVFAESQGGSPTGHPTFDRAAISLTLQVPENASTLSFDWKFGSEEPPSFSNPPQALQFTVPDYFTANLEGTNYVRTWVNQNMVLGANVPTGFSSAPLPPYPAPDNSIYNSVTANLQTAVINVVPYRGQIVTLILNVADVTDFVYDSGVFLDNLRFDKPCGEERYEYVAKIICGVQESAQDTRLARGFYASAINIHNPNEQNIDFFKKLALTFPPKEQRPGDILPIATDTLAYDEALAVDCDDLQREIFPNGFPTPYIKGFIVVQSSSSLDVTAVYTAAALDSTGGAGQHSSIDVEQIHERKTSVLPPLEPKALDHFKIYRINSLEAEKSVLLNGQFDNQPIEARLPKLTHFANPTRKLHVETEVDISNPNGHLNWYTLEQPQQEPRRTIRFENQFGQHSIDIRNPRFLLIPAQKTSDEGSSFPTGLDHYKCYEVINVNTAPQLPAVILEDQFIRETEQLTRPTFFCLPVSKHLPGLPVEGGIMNEVDHLAIYDLQPKSILRQIQSLDQFGERQLEVIQSVMLAVPSIKQVVVTHQN